MKYIAVIKDRNCDTNVKELQTWQQVTYLLRHGLKSGVYMVDITKYSSDSKQLGRKVVTMANVVDVCLSLSDKILKSE